MQAGPEGMHSFTPDTTVQNMDNLPEQKREDDSTREKFRDMLRQGKLDDREVELDLPESRSTPMVEIMTTSGMEDMQSNLQDAFSKIFPKKKRSVR